METLLRIKELAAELRMAPQTVRREIARGHMPHHRLGRRIYFTQADIKSYLENTAVPAGQSVTRY